jgi:hypothetical protein
MSALSDALKGIRQVLLLQDQVQRLEQLTERQGQEIGRLADDLISVDKRVVRIETMIEMSGRAGSPPRIEGQ